MYNRETYVKQMQSYLGAKKGDSKHKHIVDTYNSHKPLARGYKLKYTDAWCAGTTSAASIECGYTEIIPTECSCTRMIELLKQKGSWVGDDNYIPLPGDLIFYNWSAKTEAQDVDGLANHVGVVEECKNGIITVIEGNKDNKCQRRTIKVGWKYIHSFGVPKFDKDTSVEAVWHKVSVGENLTKIAKKYGTTVDALVKLNSIKNKNLIWPGQKLRIR